MPVERRDRRRQRCLVERQVHKGLVDDQIGTGDVRGPRQPGAPLKPGFNLFSRDQDVQLGREAAAQVQRQVKIVQNQFLQDYIQRVGQRLGSQPDAGNWPFSFKVVLDPNINAFALPGGPTFINTGTIEATDNEAQLAGVMAHELAHVALRHGTNQASKANLMQIPAALAGAIVGNNSMLGQLAQLGIGLGFNSVLLKYSRDDESQADALGSHIMAEAGYNPIEMARFFEKLQGAAGSRAPTFLSDHPNPGNRMQAIEAEVRTLPQRNYGFATSQFQQAKQEVERIPGATPRNPSNSARNSADRSANYPSDNHPADVRPSGQLQEFQGRDFTLAYPPNWQVFGDNNSGSVTIAPREGLVQDSNGNTQIGYGVMASYFFPESQRSLQQNTDDLVHHLHAMGGLDVGGHDVRRRPIQGEIANRKCQDDQHAERDTQPHPGSTHDGVAEPVPGPSLAGRARLAARHDPQPLQAMTEDPEHRREQRHAREQGGKRDEHHAHADRPHNQQVEEQGQHERD